MKNKFLLGLGMTALAWNLGCAHLNDLLDTPQVQVKDVQPTRITPYVWQGYGRIVISNPAPLSWPVDRIQVRWEMDGQTVDTRTQEQVPNLHGHATEIMDLAFQIPKQKLEHILGSHPRRIHVTLVGRITSSSSWGPTQLDFKHSTTWWSPVLPHTRLYRIDPLPSGQALQVQLQVENPNPFPLQLQSISGTLIGPTQSYTLQTPGQPNLAKPKTTSVWALTAIANRQKHAASSPTPSRSGFLLQAELAMESAAGLLILPLQHEYTGTQPAQ